MRKYEFLATLEKETDNSRLVEYYEELIADRVAAGEDEKDVIASFDIKRIIRTAKLEKVNTDVNLHYENEKRYIVKNANKNTNPIVYLVITLISLAIFISAFVGLIYGISELIEELNSIQRDDEWYEYIIWIVVSGILLIVFLIIGIITLRKYLKRSNQKFN